MKIAIIKWEDASLYGNATKWKEDLPDIRSAPLISAGVVIEEREKEIVLCQDFDTRADGSWRSVGVIPKSGILKVRYINVPKSWLEH